LHLIDAYTEDVATAYRTVKDELKAYQPELAKRPEIIALTKVEGLDEEIIADLSAQLMKAAPRGTPIVAISSQSGAGLQPLLFAVKDMVKKARSKHKKTTPEEAVPVLALTDTSDAYTVTKDGDTFVITGERIEKFARRTDFDNDQGVQRLRDIMRRAGILHELRRQGIAPGQTIIIGKNNQNSLTY
jgi:GTPase